MNIVNCFRNGGGVPYDRFPRFHAVMAEDSGQSVWSSLESHVLPLVPDLRERLSRGIDVLDLGCGSGHIVNRLAQLFPSSRFEGQDLSAEAVSAATKEATAKNLRNVSFVARDLSDSIGRPPRTRSISSRRSTRFTIRRARSAYCRGSDAR